MEISSVERDEKGLMMTNNFTYGEVEFGHFVIILKLLKPKIGDIFWDLGCGAARPIIAAALLYPKLKVCKGIELLTGLTECAKKVASNLK